MYIQALADASDVRSMAHGFYEPRLVHCKQSAYLLHGSLILVQVKYKRGHCASMYDQLPRRSTSSETTTVCACTDNFMPLLRRFPIRAPHENGD